MADHLKELERIDGEIANADKLFRREMTREGGSWEEAERLGIYINDWAQERKLLLDRMPPAERRSADTVHFLRQVYQPGDRLAVWMKNQQLDRGEQRITTLERLTDPETQKYLRARNAHGWNIYVHPQALKPTALGRTREDIAACRTVYLDLDKGGAAAVTAIRTSKEVPRPNWVINTSPGKFHAVWRTNGLDLDSAERLTKGLAKEFGGDPAATPLTQPLRVPGFANKKYPELHWVTAERGPHAIARAPDFHQRFFEREEPVRRPELDRRHLEPPGGRSANSERRVPEEILLDRAVAGAGNGRNRALFDGALQFRDNGYSLAEAERALRQGFVTRVSNKDTGGRVSPITDFELRKTVESAYRQPAREPWPDRPMEMSRGR